MGTSSTTSLLPDEIGVLPRVFKDIFYRISNIEKSSPKYSFSVRCSYLEIYCDDLRDLLDLRDNKDIGIHEVNGMVIVTGIAEPVVNSARELEDYLNKGSIYRYFK